MVSGENRLSYKYYGENYRKAYILIQHPINFNNRKKNRSENVYDNKEILFKASKIALLRNNFKFVYKN